VWRRSRNKSDSKNDSGERELELRRFAVDLGGWCSSWSSSPARAAEESEEAPRGVEYGSPMHTVLPSTE
jgi:hypothetical protein